MNNEEHERQKARIINLVARTLIFTGGVMIVKSNGIIANYPISIAVGGVLTIIGGVIDSWSRDMIPDKDAS